jgi:hypothetical protein
MNQLTALNIEKRPSMRERIRTELLTQPHHGRAQPMHGRTASAKLGQQPRLDELPPAHVLITGTLGPNNRRVVHPAPVITIDPPARRARGQHQKPVHVGETVDSTIEQRNRHRSILSRTTDTELLLNKRGTSKRTCSAVAMHTGRPCGTQQLPSQAGLAGLLTYDLLRVIADFNKCRPTASVKPATVLRASS